MIKSLTVTEFKEKIYQENFNQENYDKDSFKEANYLLIDCREQAEWDEGHIPGARLMPLSNFDKHIEQLSEEKISETTTIVCQCRSGKRSLQAATMLLGEGFQDIYNLEGGILAWLEAGYEVK